MLPRLLPLTSNVNSYAAGALSRHGQTYSRCRGQDGDIAPAHSRKYLVETHETDLHLFQIARVGLRLERAQSAEHIRWRAIFDDDPWHRAGSDQ